MVHEIEFSASGLVTFASRPLRPALDGGSYRGSGAATPDGPQGHTVDDINPVLP